MNCPASTRRRSRGATLIDICVAVGICAVIAGYALPAMTQFRQEQALRASAEALAGDLRFARSEAVRTGEPVYFRFSGKGAQGCYVLHTGARNDCDCAGGRAVCKVASSGVIKAEWLTSSRLQLRSNAETLEFQDRQGLVTQTGSIDLSLDKGPGIRLVVAITGRVRRCYTGAKLSGMTKCT